jgi:hypothetical protein
MKRFWFAVKMTALVVANVAVTGLLLGLAAGLGIALAKEIIDLFS